MTIPEQLEEIKTEICDRYCKYPDNWDEEKDGELVDSDICRDCPLNRL